MKNINSKKSATLVKWPNAYGLAAKRNFWSFKGFKIHQDLFSHFKTLKEINSPFQNVFNKRLVHR